MNLEKIKEIVNSDGMEDSKKMAIYNVLAKDNNAIYNILQIIEIEREMKNELINDLGINLSMAHIYIETLPPEPKVNKKEKKDNLISRQEVMDKIEKFYKTYSDVIRHAFNRFN